MSGARRACAESYSTWYAPFLLLNHRAADRLQIESGEIAAKFSASGTVTFEDADASNLKGLSASDIDRALREAQIQGERLKSLEEQMERSREYLTKVRTLLSYMLVNADSDLQAVKAKDEGGAWIGSSMMEEDLMLGSGQWENEAAFA
jgi:hypothetical protein